MSVPAASAGNSICPPHDLQTDFKNDFSAGASRNAGRSEVGGGRNFSAAMYGVGAMMGGIGGGGVGMETGLGAGGGSAG